MRLGILAILFLLSLSIRISAQITFNEVYDSELGAQIISDCLTTDTSVIFFGTAIDSAFRQGVVKMSISLIDGSVLNSLVLVDSQSVFRGDWSTIIQLEKDRYISAVTNVTNGKIEILEFSEFGEFNIVKAIGPFHGDQSSFIVALQIKKEPSSGRFYILSHEANEGGVGNDLIIYCLDSEYNLKWSRNLVGSQVTVVGSTVVFKDSIIHVFGGNRNTAVVDKNFQFYCVRYDLDRFGNRINAEQSNNGIIRNLDYEAIFLKNEDMIITSSRGYEVCNRFGQACNVFFDNSIIRVDPEMNIVWENNEGTQDTGVFTGYFDLYNEIEDQCVVAVGTAWDTTDQDRYSLLGVLTKVDYMGNTQWVRHYLYEGSEYPVEGRLRAVDRSPDGGYVAAGTAYIYAPEEAGITRQQAWILKVDDYGCLVPGCHLINNIESAENNNRILKCYPNPTSSQLSVYSGFLASKSDPLIIELYSYTGQLIRKTEQTVPNLTVTWNVSKLMKGTYTVVIRNPDKVKSTETVIIQN